MDVRDDRGSGGGQALRLLALLVVVVVVGHFVLAKRQSATLNNEATEAADEATRLVQQGQVDEAGKKFDEAIEKYEKALEMNPKLEEARKNLAGVCYDKAWRVLDMKNRYAEAQKLYEKAVEHGCDEPALYWRLANACWGAKDNEGALKALDMHGKMHPKDHRTENLRRIVKSGKRPRDKEVAERYKDKPEDQTSASRVNR